MVRSGNNPRRSVVEGHGVEKNDGIQHPPVVRKALRNVCVILLVAVAPHGITQIGSVQLEFAEQIA
jgi:hypothetical protein